MQSLQDHLGPIWQIVRGGWDDYLDLYSDLTRVTHCSTTRAGIVHDHQIRRASEYAQSRSDVRLLDFSKLKVLVVDGQFAIRFKKFDGELKSANQPTRQVQDFRSQEQLGDLPPTYNIEAGYLLDQLETEIQGVYLVCPNRNGNFWTAELNGEVATQRIFDLFEYRELSVSGEEEVGVALRPKKTGTVIKLRREKDDR